MAETSSTEQSGWSKAAEGLGQKPNAGAMGAMLASGNWQGAAAMFAVHALTFEARKEAAENTAKMAIAAGEYDSNLVSINMYNTLDLMSRQAKSFASKQTAQSAAAGFSVSSQSNLEIMNEAMRQTEREAYKVKQDAEHQRRKIKFQADSAAAAARAETSGGFFGSLF